MIAVEYTKKSDAPVTVVEISGNSKTGEISATYASQITCSDDCPLKGVSCYAEQGLTGFTTRRVNRNAERGNSSPEYLAQLEATLIDSLKGKRPLRVHVVGDCSTDQTASIIGRAMVKYSNRSGQKAYTYTHSWRRVKKSSWLGASVLASCDSIDQIDQAWSRGYGCTVVLSEPHKTDKAYFINGKLLIPCPAQTRENVNCEGCKLCFDADKLFQRKATVAFAPEGRTGKNMRIALKTV